MLTLVGGLAFAANNAEVSTSNLRAGAAFDNIKASWGKALNCGDLKTNLECKYDYLANKNFLKSASLRGDLKEGDDLSVSYEVEHSFKDEVTDVKLTAVTQGTTLRAKYNTNDQFREVSLSRDIEIGDQKVGVQPSYLVKSKTARIKLMSALGSDSKDRVNAQVDYGTEDGNVAYEVGFDRSLEEGRDLSTKFRGEAMDLEVKLVDSNFEKGAVWTAKANVPVDTQDASNILDSAKLTLKRSWRW